MLFNNIFKRVSEEKQRREEGLVNSFEMYMTCNQEVKMDALFNPIKYEEDYIKWRNETMRQERI